jgi:glycine dehydrogenase subunit 2
MTVNPSGWRPSAPANAEGEAHPVTGNRARRLEEPLLFEMGSTEQTGVDFDPFAPPPQGEVARSAEGGADGHAPSVGFADGSPKGGGARLSNLQRSRPIGLPGLSEPEAVRHYTRLSRQNYAIDLGLFPLG